MTASFADTTEFAIFFPVCATLRPVLVRTALTAAATLSSSRENRENILQNYTNIISISENSAIIPQNNNARISAIVTSVSDGDTISVDENGKTHKIRILGLDTPESFESRFGYVECYGKEARDFLKNYLKTGTKVEIIFHGNDKYNRDLAEVFYNGESIATTMIKNGYGFVYRGGIEPSNYQELLQIEKFFKKFSYWSLVISYLQWRKKTNNQCDDTTSNEHKSGIASEKL